MADEVWSDSSVSDEDVAQLSDDELRRRFAAGQLTGTVKREQQKRRVVPTDLKVAMATKVEEFQISQDMDFSDTLMVQAEAALPEDVDPEDDFKREDAFYLQTLSAVNQGEKLLKEAQISYRRPADYFAEMLKTDDHMLRVRQKLLKEKQSAEASERARKQREIKNFGKKVQQDILEKRQQAKKAAIQSVARHRKGLTQLTDLDFDVDVEDAEAPNRRRAPGVTKNAKRQKKDAKYGLGGPMRLAKRNSMESSSDMSGFNSKKNKAPFASKGPGQKGGKKAKRPGKSKRQQGKGRK